MPVVSQPHPERKSILIEANALLLVDLPSGSSALEAAYRIPYSFDSRNSSFTGTQSTPDLTGFSRLSARPRGNVNEYHRFVIDGPPLDMA